MLEHFGGEHILSKSPTEISYRTSNCVRDRIQYIWKQRMSSIVQKNLNFIATFEAYLHSKFTTQTQAGRHWRKAFMSILYLACTDLANVAKYLKCFQHSCSPRIMHLVHHLPSMCLRTMTNFVQCCVVGYISNIGDCRMLIRI